MDTLKDKFGGDNAWPRYSYDELVTSRGAEIIAAESDDDYQGDTYYLLKDGDQFGYLVVGWGSCSGCDALEDAQDRSFAEVQELRDSLINDILWGAAAEILAHIEGRDEANDWYVRQQTYRRFKARALNVLKREG